MVKLMIVMVMVLLLLLLLLKIVIGMVMMGKPITLLRPAHGDDVVDLLLKTVMVMVLFNCCC